MAAGTICVTIPVVAAAVGLYLCDRTSHSKTTAKEIIGGGARAKSVEVKAAAAQMMPKLAPQFDGLDCFETFVGRL